MEEIESDILLSSLPFIGPITFNKLISIFGNSKKVLNSNKESLIKAGFKEKIINSIISPNYRNNLEKTIKKLEKEKIKPISQNNNLYPFLLKKIKDAPIILYLKGNINILNDKNIAIVGSRKCSEYGQTIAREFSCELAQNDIVIISGMALGIDTYAHFGALDGNGKTIAVLAGGFDHIYPKENEKLFYKILENDGTIVTEYLPNVIPYKGNFIARNRIIAGMSKCILIPEANEKSGALITAKIAKNQGKHIFCIPSNITNIYNKGGNEFLKFGGEIITKSSDIFNSLGIKNNHKYKKIKNYKDIIIEEISKKEISAVELSKKLGINIARISAELTFLELKGLIKKQAGGFFKIAN